MAINANLGKASIAIRATLDELDKDLEGARGKTEGAISKITKGAGQSFQDLGKVALAGVGIATGAIAGLIGVSAKLATSAADYSSVRDSFENMTQGIVGDTAKWEQSVIDATAGTIGRFEVVETAARTFAKMGGDAFDDFGSQFEGMAVMARKTGRALGKDTSEVLDRMSVAMGTGNMQMLRMLGIAPDLETAMAEYAEELGKTTGELTEGEIGAARYNAVMDAMEKQFGDVEVTAGGLGGMIAEMKSWWSDLMLDVGLKVMPIFNELARAIFPLVEQAIAALLPHLDRFLEWVQSIVGPITDFFGRIEAGVDPGLAFQYLLEDIVGTELAETILEWVDKIRDFIAAAWEVIDPIIEWIGENVELTDMLIALGAAMMFAVGLILGPVILAFLKIMAVFAVVTAVVAAVRSAWQSNFLGIQDITTSVIGFVRGFIETAVAAIRSFWEQNGEAILASARRIWETIQSVTQTVWAAIQTVIETVASAIQSIIETVTSLVQRVWENHGEALTTAAQNTWEMIQSIIERVVGIIQGIIDLFHATLKGDAEAAGAALRDIWDNFWGLIGDIVRTAVQNIITTFSDVNWGDVGRAIIEGIASGITGALGLIRDAARGAAQNALDAAKGFLGIGSPSKVSGKEIGAPWVAGIAQRIERDMQRLGRQLPQMMDVMVQPAVIKDSDLQAPAAGRQQVIIYGLTLTDVQDSAGLLRELQALT